ncbi:MAG: PIN domain-containing protein [Planctomycetaceae bacterium]|jgi:predicted nucleic acid-binding protein|nr:PIN domain-containing protein [Planctomycetaceae bacterium]
MIRALIDTNVVLDAYLQRGEFAFWALEIIQKIEEERFEGCISASTITDLYFIVRKNTQKTDVALKVIESAYALLTILPVDKRIIRLALDSAINDFEDAVQAFVAKAMNVDIVVTRDKTGFADSGMTVFTPQEFLTYLELPSE